MLIIVSYAVLIQRSPTEGSTGSVGPTVIFVSPEKAVFANFPFHVVFSVSVTRRCVESSAKSDNWSGIVVVGMKPECPDEA
jgi:hypothetical protein